jgi:hypothetical protein
MGGNEEMNTDKMSSLVTRVFFFGAFLFLAIAVIEKIANLGSQTILGANSSWSGRPERLLEFGVIMMIFVIALILRQIREELKRARTLGS